jgi:hypothetical protein
MTTKKLPEKRQGFLELNAERTRQLMRAYLPDLPENDAHPFVLDFLFAAWLDDPERGGLSEGEVVAAISCAFGQFLADRYGFYWFVDADEKMGSGLGVMRDEPEIRVFPGGHCSQSRGRRGARVSGRHPPLSLDRTRAGLFVAMAPQSALGATVAVITGDAPPSRRLVA